ncbi:MULTISPECIES: FecR family protein [Sphingobacterium]|uniref:FecR family protein n=1 Tax=Sphingobacterium TaxID=28453 RepID=UPI0010EDA4BF|nr:MULTISPECIES: FecR domain-containing protein [Sphingobacterium]MCW2263164.1 ferric-dicitrate binding protein FerR (iron transport regulator) [Sphingobacterium kitahiroshimense]TCR11852.1 FecR family protein [Sphingobacterium sp. JUb78]
MDSQFEKYKNYKAADFFADENFVQSNLEPTANDFWVRLGSYDSELAVEMDNARLWMTLIKEQPIVKGQVSSDERWNNIQKAVPAYVLKQRKQQLIKMMIRWTARAAAIIAFVFIIYDISQFGTKSTNTAYGERTELLLPDASIIKLNSNSKLSYVRDWKTDKPREVWFEGEGLFDVKHTAVKNRLQENDLFVVHVGDLSLTVLGTKFNVKDRRGLIEVTLFEGSIKINGKNGLDRLLEPGETFIYDEDAKVDQIVQINPVKVSSWTRGELNIEHSNLANIISVLEDNYGYQVIVEDPTLLDKRFTGTIPAKGIEDVLFVIKHTMNVNITLKNKQIIIKADK